MPFDTGRVTFTRFHVAGDAPPRVDDTVLSILSEHRFRESDVGAPDEVEAGFTTGAHLFDTRFTLEKNGYAPAGAAAATLVYFALRVDTHKVPAEVKRAYRVMNEQSAAAASPTGYASKSEKRQARETANEQVRQELADGKHRRSKLVPVLWDLAARRLYCGATGTTVIEHLSRLMRQAFAVDLEALSAGTLAGSLIKAEGRSRDYEDLRPSAFTAAPDATGPEDTNESAVETSGGVVLPWIAKSVDLKDYLGNEFLLWLWWRGEREGESSAVETEASGEVFVALDKALDMDCAWDRTGKQTLRGEHPTRLPEAGDALRTGKWPRKAGLILADADGQWELTLQGDAMVIGGATLPEPESAEAPTPRDRLAQRLELVTRLGATLDAVYAAFVQQRTSAGWSHDREAIRGWIRSRHVPASLAGRPDRETVAV
ncbi:MAG: hypothetical protein AAF710_07950 [Planctomycetota bacterium]